MDTEQHDREDWNRLALLAVSRPREGFEDLYERLVRREIALLGDNPEKERGAARAPDSNPSPKGGFLNDTKR